MTAPLAALTVVRYTPGRAVLGAVHMATQHRLLRREPGLRFHRLLGTGAGIGFSRVPDLLHWALFTVWETDADFARFEAGGAAMRQYRRRGAEIYSVLLRPVAAHGRWAGVEPFGALPRNAVPAEDGPVAVLTRATIRPSRALRFWSRVEPVDATLRGLPDLLLTFGVGEVPWLRQGTLSVWRRASAMREWAYRTAAHADVVRRTRAEAWYAEELFARFAPLDAHGTFLGRDPLRDAGLFADPAARPMQEA